MLPTGVFNTFLHLWQHSRPFISCVNGSHAESMYTFSKFIHNSMSVFVHRWPCLTAATYSWHNYDILSLLLLELLTENTEQHRTLFILKGRHWVDDSRSQTGTGQMQRSPTKHPQQHLNSSWLKFTHMAISRISKAAWLVDSSWLFKALQPPTATTRSCPAIDVKAWHARRKSC